MTAVLHDCVETSTLGEDELRSWEQLLSPVTGPVLMGESWLSVLVWWLRK